MVDLEKDKSEVAKLKVRKYNGSVFVDIRKYYDNGTKPTPKGVSLRPELFGKLVSMGPLLEEAVGLVEKTLSSFSPQNTGRASITRDGGDVKVSAELDKNYQIGVSRFKNMTLIDIRNYYNGGPTKKGISLKPDLFRAIAEWDEWKEAVSKLK